jgi:hypothetical protein
MLGDLIPNPFPKWKGDKIKLLLHSCNPSQIWIRTPKADCGEMKY